jgi:uncharacterized protein YjiS (DUF1127 family)
MQTIASTAYVAAAAAKRPLALRLMGLLVTLDAGYRNAHCLAHATDERLADLGLSRTAAEAAFTRRFGELDHAPVAGSGW